jgi:hypothetical protein
MNSNHQASTIQSRLAHLNLQGNRATYIPLREPMPEPYPRMYPNPTDDVFAHLPYDRLDITIFEIFTIAYQFQIVPMFDTLQRESWKTTKPLDMADLHRVTGELWSRMDLSAFQVWTRFADRYKDIIKEAVYQELVIIGSRA